MREFRRQGLRRRFDQQEQCLTGAHQGFIDQRPGIRSWLYSLFNLIRNHKAVILSIERKISNLVEQQFQSGF